MLWPPLAIFVTYPRAISIIHSDGIRNSLVVSTCNLPSIPINVMPAPIATPFQNHNPNTNIANTATSTKAVGLDITASPNKTLDMSTYFVDCDWRVCSCL